MTYQNDPNLNRGDRRSTADDTSYTGWIIGGVLAIAVIIGVFMMMGRDNKTTTAADVPNRPAATAPATTGTAVPAPGSGQGTAAPVQNDPPAPAR